jgi:hypothetical protein
MAIHIRRRELIAALGCTAAWPLVLRVRQRERMPVLMGESETHSVSTCLGFNSSAPVS